MFLQTELAAVILIVMSLGLEALSPLEIFLDSGYTPPKTNMEPENPAPVDR